ILADLADVDVGGLQSLYIRVVDHRRRDVVAGLVVDRLALVRAIHLVSPTPELPRQPEVVADFRRDEHRSAQVDAHQSSSPATASGTVMYRSVHSAAWASGTRMNVPLDSARSTSSDSRRSSPRTCSSRPRCSSSRPTSRTGTPTSTGFRNRVCIVAVTAQIFCR